MRESAIRLAEQGGCAYHYRMAPALESKGALQSVFLVRSEHLNHQGHLFGGALMAEIDTVAYCLLRREFGAKTFVTRAAEISFERPAMLGDFITFEAELGGLGTTSARVLVRGWVQDHLIGTATLVYVNLGPDGRKQPLQG